MSNWTRELALTELLHLISQIDSLERERVYSSAHTRWRARTLTFLEEVFGRESRYYLGFANIQWGAIGSTVIWGREAYHFEAAIDLRRQEAYFRQLEVAKGLLQAATDQLERVGLEAVYKGKDTGPEASTIVKLINLAERKLRKVVRDQPSREKEIQDAFESLLIGADIDFSRETDSIEYSSKTYTPDFTVIKADLAIEIKLCARQGREQEVIGEINDDILAYKIKYGNLLFIIYDCGIIRDIDRFIGHFEKNENVMVRVIKH